MNMDDLVQLVMMLTGGGQGGQGGQGGPPPDQGGGAPPPPGGGAPPPGGMPDPNAAMAAQAAPPPPAPAPAAAPAGGEKKGGKKGGSDDIRFVEQQLSQLSTVVATIAGAMGIPFGGNPGGAPAAPMGGGMSPSQVPPAPQLTSDPSQGGGAPPPQGGMQVQANYQAKSAAVASLRTPAPAQDTQKLASQAVVLNRMIANLRKG